MENFTCPARALSAAALFVKYCVPRYAAGILVVSGEPGILKLILYLDPAGAKTSVPVLPTLKPRKSLGVTFLTILYLSVGSVGSASFNANLVTFFIFFFFI